MLKRRKEKESATRKWQRPPFQINVVSVGKKLGISTEILNIYRNWKWYDEFGEVNSTKWISWLLKVYNKHIQLLPNLQKTCFIYISPKNILTNMKSKHAAFSMVLEDKDTWIAEDLVLNTALQKKHLFYSNLAAPFSLLYKSQ